MHEIPDQPSADHKLIRPSKFTEIWVIEGFTNEEKWVTALLSTEGEARMDNDALKPRLKAEVSMEGYHFLSW